MRQLLFYTEHYFIQVDGCKLIITVEVCYHTLYMLCSVNLLFTQDGVHFFYFIVYTRLDFRNKMCLVMFQTHFKAV